MRVSQRIGVVLTVLGITAGMASAAYAEGNWTSTISQALTGFNSRQWTDNNSDGTSTSIRFDGCIDVNAEYTPTSAEVQLTRETAWYLPDVNMGRKTLNCGYSDTQFWGQVQASNYHFTLEQIGGAASGERLNVAYVQVNF